MAAAASAEAQAARLAKLEAEARHTLKYKNTDGLKDNKGSTNWLSKEQMDKPRNHIEMAIALLRDLEFPGGLQNVPGGIAGGEWWVQLKHEPGDGIGFHQGS